MRTISFFILGLLASATVTFAQTENSAAVDTLTKEVAKAVFKHLQLLPNNQKATQIYNELAVCGDGCDATTTIRTVGGYDAVGVKMDELSLLKNTAPFMAMSPGDANAAIRKQLGQFYARYKNDNNYGKPLSSTIQAQILAKIDGLLPPNAAPEPSTTVAGTAPTAEAAVGDEADIDPTTFQMSQLERELKEKKEKEIWTMILSVIGGLLVGGGAVYLFLYRGAKAEIEGLLNENNQLRNSLENAQRTKSGNEVNSIRVDYRQKASAYDSILKELGTDNPLATIRQLKQQTLGTNQEDASVIRSGRPIIESNSTPEPVPLQSYIQPEVVPEPIPAPVRSEVFYFPPPDPNGQFDLSQKSVTLSPESAYRFSISADSPSVASFRFEAEVGRIPRFLTYRNYMIEPACESENSYTTVHTRIAMRRDGSAILENGVWRVKTKALIRYE